MPEHSIHPGGWKSDSGTLTIRSYVYSSANRKGFRESPFTLPLIFANKPHTDQQASTWCRLVFRYLHQLYGIWSDFATLALDVVQI